MLSSPLGRESGRAATRCARRPSPGHHVHLWHMTSVTGTPYQAVGFQTWSYQISTERTPSLRAGRRRPGHAAVLSRLLVSQGAGVLSRTGSAPGRSGSRLYPLCLCERGSTRDRSCFPGWTGCALDISIGQRAPLFDLLGLLETTDTLHRPYAPTVFTLYPDLTIHSAYNGYWFWGRPTAEELRQNFREITRRIRPTGRCPTDGMALAGSLFRAAAGCARSRRAAWRRRQRGWVYRRVAA